MAGEQPEPRIPLKIEEVLMAAAMGAMALITAANVVTRYLTNVSLAFTEEYSVVLMVVVALLGTAVATARGRHISIDFFVGLMSPRRRQLAEAFALLLTMLCFGLLVVFGASLTWDEYRYEVLSNGLGTPNWWYTGWLPLLSLVVVLRAAGRLVRVLKGQAA
ncbi:TRAP-type C4-dicarboxylate transport system permease small subunit [Humitalea rosea]|uniref:TRAP transporter small permease protein n=1 Tax=Humitalea rosea TaxID=990373 RepID=A0A2W7J2R6_9PROT|nr:TRAP transporter small permease [Humitalea rosea]PZW45927.1 TRAP-type C4-dicarboxylate transport system permease small subunit [Humitalea rosea]